MKNFPANWCVAAMLTLTGLIAGTSARAQETSMLVPGASEIAEVQLKHADTMTVTQQPEKPQVFQGHVDVVVVGTDGSQSRLTATKVSVFYDPDTRKMDRLVAEGSVVMTRGDMTAKSELAIYDGKQNLVDLLQDNYVKDPRGELTADHIRMHLDTNQVTAEGNVKGLVYPKRLEEPQDAP